jgi:replicative DNA helicase
MSEGLRLLSSVIATQSSGTLLRLDPDLFIDNERDVFQFMRDHYRTYHELPQASTVQTECAVRVPIANEPLEFYLNSVTDRHTYNQMADHYAVLRAQLTSRDMSAVEDTVRAMSMSMRGRQSGGTIVGMGDALGMVVDRLEVTRGMGGMTGIPAGWEGYDAITGGYQNSDLITIVGRPATGKTYNLLKQAMFGHQEGHSPLFVTTEMGIEQLGRRYAALRLGINPTLLKMNMISTYSERRIRALQAEMLTDERFKLFSVGMGAKVSSIEGLMQEFGPSAVYLDGAYLLHPTAKGKMNRIERVGEVFDELKGLTISAGIPIINTMQFNRQAGKDGKEGSLETIGFTDAVGMHSSIVVSLQLGPTENPHESREMGFLKGREGEQGKIYTHFRFAPVNMDEMSPDEMPAAEGATTTDDTDGSVWIA